MARLRVYLEPRGGLVRGSGGAVLLPASVCGGAVGAGAGAGPVTPYSEFIRDWLKRDDPAEDDGPDATTPDTFISGCVIPSSPVRAADRESADRCRPAGEQPSAQDPAATG